MDQFLVSDSDDFRRVSYDSQQERQGEQNLPNMVLIWQSAAQVLRSSVLFTEASKGWRGGGLVGRHAEVAAAGDLLASARLGRPRASGGRRTNDSGR
jgi:hypothetical protein